jgi:ubiquinone/menaquinone biosynthesis C-methylase UbiE
MKSAAEDQRNNDLTAYWRNLWCAAGEQESKDIWYAIDQVKFDYLRSYLPAGGRSLEVGCGSARLSRFLARLGFEAWGLDCEPEALRLAGERFSGNAGNAGLVSGDALALPFAHQTFDVVLSTGLLEHFPHPSPIIREMTRVLRPGGLFYSDIVPKKFSLMRARNSLPLPRHDAWERPFRKGEIVTLLAEAGLSRIVVFAAGVFPPLLPLVGRWHSTAHVQDSVLRLVGKMTRPLDGTKAADLLGLYYFACAMKPRPIAI